VHIILDDEATLQNQARFYSRLRVLATRVANPSVRLSVRCAGKVIIDAEPPAKISARDGNPKPKCDLLNALERVASDYEGHGIKDPEMLLFLQSYPIDGWQDVRQKLAEIKVLIAAYWVTRDPVSPGQKEDLEKLFAQICNDDGKGRPLFKIILQPETGRPDWIDDVLGKLEERLKGRLKPFHLERQASASPAPGFHPPSSGGMGAKSPGASLTKAQLSSSEDSTSGGRDEAVAPSLPAPNAEAVEVAPAAVAASDVAAGPEKTSARPVTEPPAGSAAGAASQTPALPLDKPEAAPSAAKAPESPPKLIQPAQWVVKEPPEELRDRTPHTMTDSRPETTAGWFVVGASRRGRLHENEGTFREDAFAIENEGGWHLIAVADGAGSHHLSRVGSNLAVETSIKAMTAVVRNEPPSKSTIHLALQNALAETWKALFEDARGRKVDFRDLSTTLLLLGYFPARNLLGVAQIGDGLLAAQLKDGTIGLLGKPESGEYSGQTYFLTNYKMEELASKVESLELPKPAKLFFVMTDGVADDLYPPLERLPGLTKPMSAIMAAANPEQALLDLIGYQRAASFDDRTLVVLCQPAKLGASAMAPQAPAPPAPTAVAVPPAPPTGAALPTQPNVSEPSSSKERSPESKDTDQATATSPVNR
jgi:hypothetical protein